MAVFRIKREGPPLPPDEPCAAEGCPARLPSRSDVFCLRHLRMLHPHLRSLLMLAWREERWDAADGLLQAARAEIRGKEPAPDTGPGPR